MLPTTYRRHTDHVTDDIRTMLPTTYRRYTDHVTDQIPTTYGPCYRPHTDDIRTMLPTTYRRHTNHVTDDIRTMLPTTYGPCYRPHTDDIRTMLPTTYCRTALRYRPVQKVRYYPVSTPISLSLLSDMPLAYGFYWDMVLHLAPPLLGNLVHVVFFPRGPSIFFKNAPIPDGKLSQDPLDYECLQMRSAVPELWNWPLAFLITQPVRSRRSSWTCNEERDRHRWRWHHVRNGGEVGW